jgi:AraC-like DNA-binding protein
VIPLKIDRAVLERELAELLDSPVSTPIRLAPVLDLGHPAGAAWIRLLRLIAADAQRPDGLCGYAVVRRRMREALITGLLHAAGHQYRDRLDDPRTVLAAPAAVRRAVDAIRASPEATFTLADLAAVAGVGRRSLQQSFQRYVGITPMAYLRQVRIERAHRDLSRAERNGTTVAQVAQRYGFTHLSRFAADYRARYGVLPSETLRS